MSAIPATAFFDSWRTYNTVVAANCMYHRAIQADIERLLRGREEAAFSLLDLGCGDAATLAPVLSRLPIQRYKGVDLSETALVLAAQNLRMLPCPAELVHCDMLAELGVDDRSYNVVYSSFALHHLARDQKAYFFRLVAQRLAEDGFFVLTDVAREGDESLSLYLKRYCDWIWREWDGLAAEEKAAICNHVQNNDLPETLTELQTLATAAGLTRCEAVARYRWHHVLCFARRSSADI